MMWQLIERDPRVLFYRTRRFLNEEVANESYKLFGECFGCNCRRIITCPPALWPSHVPPPARHGRSATSRRRLRPRDGPDNTAGATSISSGQWLQQGRAGRHVPTPRSDNDSRRCPVVSRTARCVRWRSRFAEKFIELPTQEPAPSVAAAVDTHQGGQ